MSIFIEIEASEAVPSSESGSDYDSYMNTDDASSSSGSSSSSRAVTPPYQVPMPAFGPLTLPVTPGYHSETPDYRRGFQDGFAMAVRAFRITLQAVTRDAEVIRTGTFKK